MNKTEVIRKLKKYFDIRELVCPHVFGRDGEKAWQYFPTESLQTLLAIREIIDAPMHINNWYLGGSFRQRGLRCNLCQLVADKTKLGRLYVSAHLLAQGFDFSSTMPAEECRTKIKENASKLPYPIRLEEGVNWVHFDIYLPLNSKKKITTFKG